jgi:hypothetical protein
MKQILALLILLIAMACVEPCTIYSQALPEKDTLVSLTTSEVRALLKLKAERDYLFNAVNICTKSDSVKGKVITDQQKTIDAWAITNEKTSQDLVKAQEQLYKQTARKESWRSATLIGIPISFVGGIIFNLLF